MISVDEWAEIRRLYRVEGMSIRGISRHLGVARETVARALRTKGLPQYQRARQPSKLDPFKGRITELLAEYPRLSAVRVQEILGQEGYSGGITILRDYVHQVRPRPVQAFQRTMYQPGEIGQVDWARMPDPLPDAYGKLRPVYAFVMVLGYSRLLTVVFSFRTRLVDFLRCHAEALAFFGGVPRTVVYDNLKSVVLRRRGAEVSFNPQFLPFSDRYGFRPLATWPGEPHEKGLVERPIHYLKDNFWYGRKFTSMEDLRDQGNAWRDTTCNVRIHKGLDERPVDRFELEGSHFLPLPEEPFQAEEVLFAKTSRWGYVRLDSNDYSVPLLLAGRRLAAKLDASSVRIYDQGRLMAQHARCFLARTPGRVGHHQVITLAEHQKRFWLLRKETSPLLPRSLVPGIQLPPRAALNVEQRDLAIYDGLLTEEVAA
jgi:transposase